MTAERIMFRGRHHVLTSGTVSPQEALLSCKQQRSNSDRFGKAKICYSGADVAYRHLVLNTVSQDCSISIFHAASYPIKDPNLP